MQIRLADYVADFLTAHDITDCFMVTGGGAMHLNDALGHKAGLHCTFNHHEQACAIAAESYARLENRIAALCVTTGPAACRYARWEIRSLTLHGRSPACANMPRCWRIRRISVICWKNPFIWPRTVGPDRAGSTSPSITRV